jgi:hypothetical protein
MIDINKNYKVTLFYGGESPNEIIWTSGIDEARALCDRAEHSVIEYRGREIE